jgi:hypothetical protein
MRKVWFAFTQPLNTQSMYEPYQLMQRMGCVSGGSVGLGGKFSAVTRRQLAGLFGSQNPRSL